MDEQQDVSMGTATGGGGSGATSPAIGPSKPGVHLLHDLLAVAFHVFEEAKHMNLKPPLQPSSRMFSLDAINAAASPPRSPAPPDSPSEEQGAEMNGTAHGHGAHAQHHSLGLQPVIPFSPEELQDSYTRIATLKSQYVKISGELQELIREAEVRRQATADERATADAKDKETIERLTERRNQLRREVYERNLVMKGLIDRLRHLQYTLRLIKGGNTTTPTPIVMESI